MSVCSAKARQATVAQDASVSGKFPAAVGREPAAGLPHNEKEIAAIGGRCGFGRSGIVCFRLFLGRAGLPGISGDQLHGGAARPEFRWSWPTDFFCFAELKLAMLLSKSAKIESMRFYRTSERTSRSVRLFL